MFRYEWIWIKQQGTGFLNAKKMPLKATENILVFYKKLPVYNPQMTEGKPYKCKSGAKSSSNYRELEPVHTANLTGARYPVNHLRFIYDKENLHPTQKPVALFEYMIKTYTNEGDLVLDNCSGSSTLAISAINTNRNYICIEKDKGYYDLSIERVSKHRKQLQFFV